MSYKITIEQIKTITNFESGGFGIVKKEYISQAEYEALYGDEKKEFKAVQYDKATEAVDANAIYVRDVYGYPPKREVNKTVNEKVLEQTVEELDLPAVIRAINKL